MAKNQMQKPVSLVLDAEGRKVITEIDGLTEPDFTALLAEALASLPYKGIVILDNGKKRGVYIRTNPEGITYIIFASFMGIVLESDGKFIIRNIPEKYFNGYSIAESRKALDGELSSFSLKGVAMGLFSDNASRETSKRVGPIF